MAFVTQYWGLDGLLIFCSLSIGIYIYLTRNFNYWKNHGVKQVSPTSVLGNFGPCILARTSIINNLQTIYEAGKDEPFIGYYVLDKPHLMMRDPELIKCILIRDFNNFSNRNGSSTKSDRFGNKSLFIVKNPEWKFLRQKLSPIFTSGRLKKMFDLMLEIAKDLDIYLESLKLDGTTGKDVDIKEICAKFTTDLIGTTAYGMKFNSLLDPDALLRKVGKDIFVRTYKRHIELLSAFLIPSFVKLFGFHVFGKGATDFLRAIFWEAMNARVKSGDRRADLTDLLLDMKKEHEKNFQNDIQLDDETLIAQAAILFTGGFETSSTTMSFTLFELARNPEIQKKLRAEIVDTLNQNNGKVSYDMIMLSLPYLDMVVSEVLRMYPVLPFLDRITEKDYQLPDTKITVKAGTPIVVPLMSIHKDPKYFPKPDTFDPERFSTENKTNIKSNTYFPFGDGPRFCIGMRLGLIQTKLGLIHLISKYQFSPCRDMISTVEFDNLAILSSTRESIILNVKRVPIKG